MAIYALLVAAAVAAPLTAEAAADRAKSLLASLGVSGPLRYQEIKRAPEAWPDGWDVVVTDSAGRRYEARLDLDGRPIDLGQGGTRLGRARLYGEPLTDPRYERLVRDWLSRLKGAGDARLECVIAGDAAGTGQAYFSVLREGLPFVSPPYFGYSMRFTVPNGEFLAFRGYAFPVPAVGSGKPRLDASAALDAFRRAWDAETASRDPKTRPRREWYDKVGTPVLGWCERARGASATLVWRVQYWHRSEYGMSTRGGGREMLIDAATGERVSRG